MASEHRARVIAGAIVVATALVIGLGVSYLARGESPQVDPGPPYGIAAADATRLTGEKSEAWAAEATRLSEASRRTPAPKDWSIATALSLTPHPPPEWPEGLFEHPNPFGGFIFTNEWQGTHEGERVKISAGTSQKDSSESWIVVGTFTIDKLRTTGNSGVYQYPRNEGALRITSVEGTRVNFVSEQGTGGVFDFATRQFVGPSAPTPTGTPPVSMTPNRTLTAP
jgi:hypothetical protein